MLRLLVGFVVSDDLFFTCSQSEPGCPLGHGAEAGSGPHCCRCGSRFSVESGPATITPGAKRLANRLKRKSPEPRGWRAWVADSHRNPGAIVVALADGQWVLGVLLGTYSAVRATRVSADQLDAAMRTSETLRSVLSGSGESAIWLG